MISKEKLHYIRCMTNDEWIDRNNHPENDEEWKREAIKWEIREDNFTRQNSSAEELYEFVKCYNWDRGIASLQKIAINTSCDKATALMIYWLAQPYYYKTHSLKTSHDISMHEFIGLIEKRFIEGRYKDSSNNYSPKDNFPELDFPALEDSGVIPSEMFNSANEPNTNTNTNTFDNEIIGIAVQVLLVIFSIIIIQLSKFTLTMNMAEQIKFKVMNNLILLVPIILVFCTVVSIRNLFVKKQYNLIYWKITAALIMCIYISLTVIYNPVFT